MTNALKKYFGFDTFKGNQEAIIRNLLAGNDTFVMKKVETLPSRQGKTPVKGLMPGQTIVTKGGYELKYILPTGEAGSKKAAGHFHADGQFHEGEH